MFEAVAAAAAVGGTVEFAWVEGFACCSCALGDICGGELHVASCAGGGVAPEAAVVVATAAAVVDAGTSF
jgi:hypothetical protein